MEKPNLQVALYFSSSFPPFCHRKNKRRVSDMVASKYDNCQPKVKVYIEKERMEERDTSYMEWMEVRQEQGEDVEERQHHAKHQTRGIK